MKNGKQALREEAINLFGRLVAESDPGRLDEWAALGLTMTQLRVLFWLRGEPGLAAGTLAERLEVTPSTLTRIMDRLVSNQLIDRVPDDEDRRLVRHHLSPRGAGVIEEMYLRFRSRMEATLDHLSGDELHRVVLALRDLSRAGDAVRGEPVPEAAHR